MVQASEALQILLDVTRALTEQRSLPSALEVVTNAALRLLPGNHASIRVLDESRTELLSGARSGAGLGKRPVKHTPGQGIAGWVVDTGEVARIGDTAADERFIPKANQGFAIASILAVPLWSAGQVVGVLAATSAERDNFSAEDEALACLLANCAVPPIEKARLARLAVTDAQTMAFNQAYLMPGLRTEMAREGPGPLSVLLMDLDHFKLVNDGHGHAAGDLVLRQFADRVRANTRDADVFVRRGGDEFVLIMPGTSRDDARAVADRIRVSMESAPVDLGDGTTATQTLSIGAATWNSRETPEQLEQRADVAMYAAKSAGRNRISFADTPPAPPGSATTRSQAKKLADTEPGASED